MSVEGMSSRSRTAIIPPFTEPTAPISVGSDLFMILRARQAYEKGAEAVEVTKPHCPGQRSRFPGSTIVAVKCRFQKRFGVPVWRTGEAPFTPFCSDNGAISSYHHQVRRSLPEASERRLGRQLPIH